MNKNFKIILFLGGIILAIVLIFLYVNKSVRYKNPELLQNIDKSIFNH